MKCLELLANSTTSQGDESQKLQLRESPAVHADDLQSHSKRLVNWRWHQKEFVAGDRAAAGAPGLVVQVGTGAGVLMALKQNFKVTRTKVVVELWLGHLQGPQQFTDLLTMSQSASIMGS